MKKRSNEKELMDLDHSFYSQEEYEACLKKIGLIGKLLGGDQAALQAFKKLPQAPASILDVGCGGGIFSRELALAYPQAHVVGIDIAPHAIVAANKYKKEYEEKYNVSLSNLSFEHASTPELNKPDKSFDVVTATLVCHHLSDKELIDFFTRAHKVARTAVIINDLQRSRLAYALFWIISPLFRNHMIRNDGLISIKRGFRYKELVSLLTAADIKKEQQSITWKWAFRWIITVMAQ